MVSGSNQPCKLACSPLETPLERTAGFRGLLSGFQVGVGEGKIGGGRPVTQALSPCLRLDGSDVSGRLTRGSYKLVTIITLLVLNESIDRRNWNFRNLIRGTISGTL